MGSGSQVSDKVVPKGASRRVLKERCDAQGVHCGLERSKGSGEGDRGPNTEVVSVPVGVCVCVRGSESASAQDVLWCQRVRTCQGRGDEGQKN